MSKKIIRQFKRLIVDEMVRNFSMREDEAKDAMRRSKANEIIGQHPDISLHYSPNDWAEDISLEYKKNCAHTTA